MSGINSLMYIGQSALLGNQAAIQTVGNNIANVNTEGYSRQQVVFEEYPALDHKPGQIGQGSYAAQIIRYFDEFIERNYLGKHASEKRYETQSNYLQYVESLFNESNTPGINSAMNSFFKNWKELSMRPDDGAVREALLSDADNLAGLIRNAEDKMLTWQKDMDTLIQQDVDTANRLIKEIGAINKQIMVFDDPGVNNANTLYDQRNLLVRQLSEIIDLDVQDMGVGQFTLNTKAGYTLVDGATNFSLAFEGPKSSSALRPGSTFDGDIQFLNSDHYEYTFEVVTAGGVGGASPAELKVSIDGGKSWLKNPDGSDMIIKAQPENDKVKVGNIDVYFDAGSGNNMIVGDRFNVVPKSALYWVTPTTEHLNITPMVMGDGSDNDRRITGGSLAGLFSFRDENLGKYRDTLDSLAQSVIWETNVLHSQGSGLTHLSAVDGDTYVGKTNVPLGADTADFAWSKFLSGGSMTVYAYDKTTGALLNNGGVALDFSSITPPGVANFDPAVHSLDNVAAAMNASFGGTLTATVVNHKLSITAAAGVEFEFGSDTTGLLAGLGINTFFSGTGSSDIAVNSVVRNNTDRINAAEVNGGNESNVGDNDTALKIAKLSEKSVTMHLLFGRTTTQSLSEFHAGLVASVGSDTANAKFSYSYNKTLADDLNARQDSIAGVNLDEEMASLIKYQHSYTAAAKLITTADQMFQTLLGLKQ